MTDLEMKADSQTIFSKLGAQNSLRYLNLVSGEEGLDSTLGEIACRVLFAGSHDKSIVSGFFNTSGYSTIIAYVKHALGANAYIFVTAMREALFVIKDEKMERLI